MSHLLYYFSSLYFFFKIPNSSVWSSILSPLELKSFHCTCTNHPVSFLGVVVISFLPKSFLRTYYDPGTSLCCVVKEWSCLFLHRTLCGQKRPFPGVECINMPLELSISIHPLLPTCLVRYRNDFSSAETSDERTLNRLC